MKLTGTTKRTRWVCCRYDGSSFWRWAFREGTRSRVDLGPYWIPMGVVLASSMAEAVERGRVGRFVKTFEKETEI
ncbi:MAG TPA: hypothetical protein VM238_21640 [Phycisphaerae bacterium]|nr:hypothetical protein [Phycisphaerae bacterium]